MDAHRARAATSRIAHACRSAGALAFAVTIALAGVGVVSAGTTTNATSVATDGSFSGFTVGAAVVAVLVGGGYWYYYR